MQLIIQFFKFSLVGGLAALTHLLLVFYVTEHFALRLPLANIFAFLGAFWVSFFGHYFFSFEQSAAQVAFVRALWRFFWVACAGFVVNEAVVIALVHLTTWSQLVIVSTAIIVSAIFSFIFSRYFAFHAAQD